ncbi:hypothetical protein ACJMK2_019164 [Sinanodonta woodiana]|uniref:Cysteine rich secreted protein n=1 Tax=Sinanodonta woodiana TaxID=1069815 RepID=A0ABD3UHN0_SINWO
MLLYVIFVLISTLFNHAEGGIGTLNLPACIITTHYSYQWTQCSNPLYTACGFGVCCSPNHYCCNYVGYQNYYFSGKVGCCRRTGFTARSGEIASVALGAIAWAGIVCLIGFITCPKLYLRVKSIAFIPHQKTKSRMENIIMK